MTYKLYLDDHRIPEQSYDRTKRKVYLEDWVVVRNYKEFVDVVSAAGLPSVVSFDHDLHEEHMLYFFENGGHKNPPNPLNANFKEKTGYDCALWLIEYCEKHNLKLPECMVHSVNPIGSNNIANLILTGPSLDL